MVVSCETSIKHFNFSIFRPYDSECDREYVNDRLSWNVAQKQYTLTVEILVVEQVEESIHNQCDGYIFLPRLLGKASRNNFTTNGFSRLKS